MPAKYQCSAPFIRLEGDFCGLPLSGTYILVGMAGELINRVVETASGTAVFSDFANMIIIGLVLLSLLLPLFSTILVIRRGSGRRQQVFHLAAWSLAVGLGLLWGLFIHPEPFWVLWGGLLYLGVAAGALVLELLVWKAGKEA